MTRLSPGPLGLLCLLWLSVAGIGLGLLLEYQSRAGNQDAAPLTWPPASKLRPVPGVPNLVLFGHPKCPCSSATLEQLARLLAHTGDEFAVHAVFFVPHDALASWHETSLWNAAQALPGVMVSRDPAGVEARRFGAVTSGHSLLFDADGRLVFSGGITSARGHLGSSSGLSALLSLSRTGRADQSRAPVFGCSLKHFREGGTTD